MVFTLALHKAWAPKPTLTSYNATFVKQYNDSLAKRIEAEGGVNFVVARAMASLSFVPACMTTLGQTGYAIKTIVFISFRKGLQLVGHNDRHNDPYSLEKDAKIANEHAKRAFKVAIYAVTSVALLVLGLIVPRMVTRLDSALGATSSQITIPISPTYGERFRRWCKNPKTITFAIALVTATVAAIYIHDYISTQTRRAELNAEINLMMEEDERLRQEDIAEAEAAARRAKAAAE